MSNIPAACPTPEKRVEVGSQERWSPILRLTASGRKRLEKRRKRLEDKARWFQSQRDWYRYPHIRLQFFKKRQKQRELQLEKRANYERCRQRSTCPQQPSQDQSAVTGTTTVQGSGSPNDQDPDFDSMSYSEVVLYALERRLQRPGPRRPAAHANAPIRAKKKKKATEKPKDTSLDESKLSGPSHLGASTLNTVKKRRKRALKERAPKKMPCVIKNTARCSPFLKTKVVKYGQNYEQEETDWDSD